MSTSEAECASLMLETFPLAMRTFAQEGREHVKGHYTVPQYRILFILHDQGPVSMGRMAEMHGVTLPTMTKIVSGLVERGLVEREAAPHDRRVVQLRLSAKGNELFDDIHRHLHDRIAALFAHMTDEERDGLGAGLRGLRRVLYSIQGDTPCPEQAQSSNA